MRKNILINKIKAILEDAMGIDMQDINPETSFIELGLDSNILNYIAITLNEKFSLKFTPERLKQDLKNIESLAVYIDEKLPAGTYKVEENKTKNGSHTNGASKQNISSQTIEATSYDIALNAISEQVRVLSEQLNALKEKKHFQVNTIPGFPAAQSIRKNNLVISAEKSISFIPAVKTDTTEPVLTTSQSRFLSDLITRYTKKTEKSRAYNQHHNSYSAGQKLFTGFKSFTGDIAYSIAVGKSKGSFLWDIDGNEYIDVFNSFGANMLGHQPDFIVEALKQQIDQDYEVGSHYSLSVEVCKLLCEFTNKDRAALYNTGSEAVLGAICLARKVTGRSLIIAFSGSYHGIIDEVLTGGAKKLKTYSTGTNLMIESIEDVLILEYGTPESIAIIKQRANELAAVLVEPVQSRRPDFLPSDFLLELRSFTEQQGIALIFDEVITGFRMHPQGMQGVLEINADIAIYGKAMGGGMPIGAIAGKNYFMKALDEEAPNYIDITFNTDKSFFAGSFVRHPLALVSAKASLEYMKSKGIDLQLSLNQKTKTLVNKINSISQTYQLPINVVSYGSLWQIKFTSETVYSDLFFTLMREKGIHILDGFPCFVTDSFTPKEIETIANKFEESTCELIEAGFFPHAGKVPGLSNIVITDKVSALPEAFLESNDFKPFANSKPIKVASTTEAQLELFASCLVGGDDASRSYNESVSLHFKDGLDLPAMRSALTSTINRHEALRAVFSPDGKKISVYKEVPVNLIETDISHESDNTKGEFIKEYKRKNSLLAFDLLNGPLFRVALFKLNEREYHFTFTAHHLVCDGWSIEVILKELSKTYSASIEGTEVSLPSAPLFSTYSADQVSFSHTDDYPVIENYWLKQFEGAVAVLDIPTDFTRPSVRTYKSRRDDYVFDKNLVSSVKKMGSEAGCSFVVSLLSAFEVFLHKISGQKDIILGLPSSGQSATGNYDLVGHCVNLLSLKSSIDPEQSFSDYLKQRRTQSLNDFDHQRFTYGTLLKKLKLPRDTSRVPLVPIMFNVDMGITKDINFLETNYDFISNPREYETFEIFLNIREIGQSFVFEWSYNTQLFKPATIRRMMEEFETLLHSLSTDSAVKIKEIDFRSPETTTRLENWNATLAAYPKDKPLVSLINEVALRHPGNIAIEYKQQQFTYKDLNDQSNQFAALLIQQGVVTGQNIGLAVDRSPEMIIALLAIMKAGAAYIPLDPEYPRERVEYMLENSNATVLITSKKYSQHFKTNAKEVIIEDSLAKLSSFSNQYPATNLNGSDLAYILYTSGSTGKPKGVQIQHNNLVNFLCSMRKAPGLTNTDSLLAITTISFDIAGLELYLPLISGAKIVLADAETSKDGYKLLELINNKNVSILQATPSTWRMLLDSGWSKTYGFKALCGGEALPKDLADKLLALCSSLWNVYGPTETTVWSTIKQITRDDQTITIGRPIDNTQIYILDEYLKPVPIGATGEIFIGGEGVARGYFNRADLTAERFLPNPFEKNSTSKMYRTGDLGKFLENGEIQCLGRIDHQVKIRGHRIELGEIEYQLIKLEGVKEAVVIAIDDQTGSQKLAAYIVPVSSDIINKQEAEYKSKWREAIKENLPHYMIPSDWVILKEFPLTPNNKIDKKALPKPQPDFNSQGKKNSRLPATRNEKLVAKIWQQELGCKNVNLDDNFFDLGGHSLIAVKLMNHLEKEIGKRIPLTALFEGPTVEKLASLIDKDDHKWDSFVTIKSTGSKIPIYLIHGVGLNVLIFSPLAKHLHPDQPIYGIQAKGLNGIDKLFDRMEDIASHYIDEIMQQNPNGPYAIGGYSFGGLIAFEMSKQLKAMGKEVILTCMFDSYAYTSHHHEPLHKKIVFKTHEIFMRLAYAFLFMFREPKIVLTNKVRYARILLESLFDKLRFRNRVKEDSSKGYSKRATQMYETAFNNYKITPYDGTIDVFRSKKQTYYMPDFKYLGWKPFAREGVTVHEVPGDHLEMFVSPNVEEFAKVLQACLDKATSESSGKNNT